MIDEVQSLDLENQAEIEEFERAFFSVFEPLTHNRLIRWLWDWDLDRRRLRTRVPYEEQIILVQRNRSGEIIRALAVGKDLRTVQSAAYGFHIPDRPENGEALAIFTVDRELREGLRFYRECRERLKAEGLRALYATGAPRILMMHRMVGGELLESRTIEGEVRNFVRIDLDAAVSWPR